MLSASDGTSKYIYFMQIELCEKKSFVPCITDQRKTGRKFTLESSGRTLQTILWLKGQS